MDELIPRGSSEPRAKKALGDRGFRLSRLDPDKAGSHLLIATHTRGAVTWQIGVIFVEAKVAATSVTILDARVPPK